MNVNPPSVEPLQDGVVVIEATITGESSLFKINVNVVSQPLSLTTTV